MHSSLADAAAALARAGEAVDAAAWRGAEAVGIGVDDAGDIRAVCIVYGGEIVYERVAAGLQLLPQDQHDDVIRVCRFQAWSSWRAQRAGAVAMTP